MECQDHADTLVPLVRCEARPMTVSQGLVCSGPFTRAPFYRESGYRQESPARELCNFSKWRPCNHGTSTTRVIIRAPSRSKRGAARCIDQTFTLNVNLNATRSTCESHEEERRLTSFMKEVVLEHNRSLRSTSIFFGRLFAYSVTSSCLLDRVR